MRDIPEAIASALAQGAAKLCHVWRIRRRDGTVLAFSDHDRVLVFMGVPCAPEAAMTAGAARAGIGLDGETSAALAGVLSAESLAHDDLVGGLYDGAEVTSYVVDWSDPAHHVLTGRGRLAHIEARGDGFVAHVEGLSAGLARVIGRRFGSLCDARLGDARCGLDPDSLPAPVCDKRYRTCLGTFDNGVNFRGFPDLPGEDFLTLYPRSGDVMDGGAHGGGNGR